MNTSTRIALLILCLLFTSLTYAQQTYYISSSGNDANSGTSESRPWKSMAKINSVSFGPGDKILFKRGDRWGQELLPRSSGSPGKSIVIGAYGSGNKPIIAPTSGPYAVNVRIRSYILIENLHVIAPPKGHGIALRGDARGNEVRYCLVEGNKSNDSQSGITFSVILEGKYGTSNQVHNNEVFNFFEGIVGSGGLKNGGLVENNYIHDARPGGEDGIVAKRGDFEGLIIRNNEIKGWRDDGIDLYGGNNVIVEYNLVHDVASQLNGSGNGIKAGGTGVKSENCIIRYNKVYNLNPSSSSGLKNGISTNGGDKAQIYGNLIYNVKGEAIAIPKESNDITIYHNTAISNSKEALYVGGTNVTIRNNIFWGGGRDLNINQPVKGSNNLFVDGAKQTKYAGSNDITAPASQVFANVSGKDYHLKAGSPAIDKGMVISGYNASIEKISIKGAPDIGAYEFGGSTAPTPSEDLKVNAGGDQSLTLPANSISLSAQVTGASGASVSYQWTKKNGPSATLENSTTSKLSVRNMQAGSYTFAVTAQASGRSATDEVVVSVKPKAAESPSPPSSDNGLRYRYYEGAWNSLPNFDQQKVIKQGVVSNFDLEVRQRNYDFAVVYDGSINITTPGTYTFYTASDDGSKLYIDGKQIVNNDGLHGQQERDGTITLTKGKHAIEVRYFERSGQEVLEISYAGPGVSKRRIPSDVLSPDKGSNPPGDEPTAPEAPSPSTEAWLEAECANSIGDVWQLINDEKAAGGSYLKVGPGNSSSRSVPTSADSRLMFNFSVSQAGQYKIFTRHRADNQGDNSFWIQINDGSWIDAHVGIQPGVFVWAQVESTTYSLQKGNNQIRVAFREPNARLDKIYVTLTGGAPSDKGGSATNCGASPAPVAPQPTPTNGIVSVKIQDKTVSLPQKQVTLRGIGDGPNPFRGYRWEKVSGPSVRMEDQNTANAQLYDLQVGPYVFRFTATDSEGNSGSGKMTLTVTSGKNAHLAQQQKKTILSELPATTVTEMSVYPNPVVDRKVFIRLPDTVEEAVVQVYSYDGRLLRTVRRTATQGIIALGEDALPTERGAFLLSIKTAHQQHTFRLLMD